MALLRFYIRANTDALSEPIRNVFSPDLTDYFFGYDLAPGTGGELVHDFRDGWERVPADGIMDVPLSTTETSRFYMELAVVPNSMVDPDAPESQRLQRYTSIHTDDFAPIKAPEYRDLVKKFPDGVFILHIFLVALYIPILVAGSTTFEAESARAKIPGWDIVYHAHVPPITDASGKVIVTHHDVVYWDGGLRLSGKKYVP